MAENIRLEVVTPEKSVVSESAQIVMAPGSLGEFGVLSGHTPFLTTLKTGALKYKDESGRERFVFVSSGFAEALPDRVTVLAESAERRKDIDIQRAKAAWNAPKSAFRPRPRNKISIFSAPRQRCCVPLAGFNSVRHADRC
jgi:F-type H+-transporting ATPase subunit epsilon